MEKKILLVEDDKNMLKSLLLLFEHAGFRAHGVDTIKAAKEAMETEYFAVVITDLLLPDGEGYDIMAYCSERSPETKVIAITGFASLDSVVTALRKGAYDYVIKPFDFDLLKHAVEKAIEAIHLKSDVRRSKERYAELVEYLDDGFFVLDGTNIVYANDAMSRYLGISKEKLLGTSILNYVDERDRHVLQAKLKNLRQFEAKTFLEEFRFKRFDDGEKLVAEVKLSYSPSQGNEDKCIGLIRDISERKKLWQQLVRAEKMALMGEMVAGIAHELNNKLTPILAYIDILAKEQFPNDIKQKLNVIFNAALGAKGIVESLLIFSRQEKPAIGPCDINQLLQASKDLVSASFTGSDVIIHQDLEPNLPLIKGDPLQLEQVFSNIIKNAFEALAGSGQIKISTTLINDDIAITIEDTGPGIPADIIPRIFDPFFSTKGKEKGTGLGLSICYGIIKEHGGDIGVCCDGTGTRFSILLPVSDTSEYELPGTAESSKTAIERKDYSIPRILIVEDEVEIANLLAEVLKKTYEVKLAKNGEEALEYIKSTDFDLIISDIRMPGLDGIALYHKLRELNPSYLDRIIYSTGVTCDDRTRRFLAESRIEYIKKPFRLAELMEIIKKKLQGQKTVNAPVDG